MNKNFTLLSKTKLCLNELLSKVLMLSLFIAATGMLMSANAQVVNVINSGYLVEEPAVGAPMTDYHILYLEITPQDENGLGTIDSPFTLSQGEIAAWGDYSIAIRFLNIGRDALIDCRNGGGFAVVESVPFVFGDKYKIWIETSVADLKFSAYVQSPDMNEPVKIADNYDYRKQDVTELVLWSCLTNPNNNNDNSLLVENMKYVDAVGTSGETTVISSKYDQKLKVFPNPSNGSFLINFDGKFTYELFNLTGTRLLTGEATNSTKLGEQLIPGAYIIKVKQANIEKAIKVVKF